MSTVSGERSKLVFVDDKQALLCTPGEMATPMRRLARYNQGRSQMGRAGEHAPESTIEWIFYGKKRL